MATRRNKQGAVKKSISAPESLWNATEQKIQKRIPPVPLSRHLQELMARDLGLSANGKEAHA